MRELAGTLRFVCVAAAAEESLLYRWADATPLAERRTDLIYDHPDGLQIIRFHARRNHRMIRRGTGAGNDLQCS